MNKKIILTSFIALGFACPAMAESFPSDGSMLENKTYDGAATYDNTGVYEGNVTAQAYYDWDLLSPTAGQYLPQGATDVETCTTGSFCPGATDIHYDNTQDQGIESCPDGFGNSAAGATANTECYRTCDIANMGANGSIANIAHAATLTGNDYYGNGADTCEPATCVAGWHIKAGDPSVNLSETIGTEDGTDYEANGMSWTGDFGDSGMVKGQAQCSTKSGTFTSEEISTETSLPDSTGQYCYCNVTSYTPAGGSEMSLSSSWVFREDRNSAGSCAYACAGRCALSVLGADTDNLRFRAALFGSAGASAAICEANTINITWEGATEAAVEANNAGSTVYEGDIRTPSEAIPVTGKSFKGWKFLKPSNNNNGNN